MNLSVFLFSPLCFWLEDSISDNYTNIILRLSSLLDFIHPTHLVREDFIVVVLIIAKLAM